MLVDSNAHVDHSAQFSMQISTCNYNSGGPMYRVPSGGFVHHPVPLPPPPSYPHPSSLNAGSNMVLDRYTPVSQLAQGFPGDDPPGPGREMAFSGQLNLQGSPLRSRYLWLFLLRLLEDDRYSALITWTRRRELEFQLRQPEEVAALWGRVKRRSNMTYDKMSRAMRYYYKQHVLRKVRNKRYVYKFLRIPSLEQQQQPSTVPLVSPTESEQGAGHNPERLALPAPHGDDPSTDGVAAGEEADEVSPHAHAHRSPSPGDASRAIDVTYSARAAADGVTTAMAMSQRSRSESSGSGHSLSL